MKQFAAPYTERQLAEGRRRREVLEYIWGAMARGQQRGKLLSRFDVQESTYRDWCKLYRKNQNWDDLIPKRANGNWTRQLDGAAKLADDLIPALDRLVNGWHRLSNEERKIVSEALSTPRCSVSPTHPAAIEIGKILASVLTASDETLKWHQPACWHPSTLWRKPSK